MEINRAHYWGSVGGHWGLMSVIGDSGGSVGIIGAQYAGFDSYHKIAVCDCVCDVRGQIPKSMYQVPLLSSNFPNNFS